MHIIYALLFSLVFWILFVSIMTLYKRRKQLIAGFLFYTLLPIGFMIDVVYNVTLGSLIFWELPHELTLSQRMTRHIKEDDGWRKKVATWICSKLVEPWDYNHCHLQDQ